MIKFPSKDSDKKFKAKLTFSQEPKSIIEGCLVYTLGDNDFLTENSKPVAILTGFPGVD